MKHLTDEQLQARLDRCELYDNPDQEAHLRSCGNCRERLGDYERLYSGLAQDRGYELSPGFAETLVTRLAAAAPTPTAGRSWEWLLAGTGLVAAACLATYFVDMSSLMVTLARPFAPMAQTSQAWLSTGREMLSSASGYTVPLALSATILVTVKAAENLLLALKDRRLFCL